MQATSLVHEAYLRLVDVRHIGWQNRAHFFAMAARVMRRILVDNARTRQRPPASEFRRSLDGFGQFGQFAHSPGHSIDRALAAFDPRKAQLVEMRYFGGLTANEIASVLSISHQSVSRDWALAKAWLAREMNREECRGAAALGSH